MTIAQTQEIHMVTPGDLFDSFAKGMTGKRLGN
jgi:hypothetical protein